MPIDLLLDEEFGVLKNMLTDCNVEFIRRVILTRTYPVVPDHTA